MKTQQAITKKRPPRTIKERKFAQKIIVEGKSPTQAALEVYDVQNSKDPYNTAGTIASQNMQKLTFEHYFQKAGLTDEVIALNVSQMALGATKRDHFSGEIEPDNQIRLKATELAVKIQNKMPKGDEERTSEGNTINIMTFNITTDGRDNATP